MALPQISLAMIVRNEGTRLAQCLESIKEAVDEIVVVDTGSSDNTKDIARKYTCKVYSYSWNNDFAAARNYAIEQTTGEWVLSLDADERLEIGSDELYSLISQTEYSAFCLPLCSQKDAQDFREYDRFMVLRLFRRNYRFKNPVHEYVSVDDPALIGYSSHPVIWHTTVSIAERHARRGRNLALLKTMIAKNKTDPYLNYYLGIEWLGLRRIDFAIAAFQAALRQLSTEQVVFRSPAVRNLISSYKNAGKIDEAIRLCLEESQHYPGYCDLFFDGGVLFELKGEYEIAIKWFQEAVRLGPPHHAFYHTDGTEAYLAYYHLGYCSEKLGIFTEAQRYYEQALDSNKNYYYPLYPLVLLNFIQQSAIGVLVFLRERGYLAIPEVPEKIADLFRIAGFPDIGMQCLENNYYNSKAGLELFARCQMYSGEVACAVQSIAQMRLDGIEPTTGALVDEIVALLMIDRFNEARQRLWSLWRTKDSRHVFRAVFCLYKKMANNTLLPLANLKAATTLLDLRERCLHVRTKNLFEQNHFASLISTINDILISDAETMALLINDLSEREKDVKQSLEYTFTALRGLCR